MKTMDGIDFAGKNVLLRIGADLAIKDGQIQDDSRIRASLNTIKRIIDQGTARLTILNHMGRPEGKIDESLKLKPVALRLAELLGESSVQEDGQKGYLIGEKIYLLENIRFDSREQSKDNNERESLAKELLENQDIYINDAFNVSHRAEASVKECAELAPQSAAGEVIQKEVEALEKALNPEHPAICILGGVKVADKVPVLKQMINIVDTILIGGAASLPFLKAQGFDIKNSAGGDEESLIAAKEVLALGEEKLVLPITDDLVWTPEGTQIVDIGPHTVQRFNEFISQAKSIIWNGPMGKFEESAYAKGTIAVAESVASSNAVSFVGGGESVQAITQSGVADKITFLSTGGGAALEYLSGEKLPGLIPLEVYN